MPAGVWALVGRLHGRAGSKARFHFALTGALGGVAGLKWIAYLVPEPGRHDPVILAPSQLRRILLLLTAVDGVMMIPLLIALWMAVVNWSTYSRLCHMPVEMSAGLLGVVLPDEPVELAAELGGAGTPT